jgi:phosphate transport system permease protein
LIGELPRVQPSTSNIARRRRSARIWSLVFLGSILLSIAVLAILLLTIANQAVSWTVVDQRGRIVETWNFSQGIFNRAQIEAVAAEKAPGRPIELKFWLTSQFLTSLPSQRNPLDAGLLPALIGSLMLVGLTTLVAFPIGVGAAIYLEEYANQKSWYNRIIQVNIANLAGVPSIIYGLLGLTLFVRVFAGITNGRSVLSGGLTMALLVLPVIIIAAQESIRAVPLSLRQASYGLGATKWQTIWHHILPNAIGGILTGTILAISRAIGETAPLIVVGVGTLLFVPRGVFDRFSALPYQIYGWTSASQKGFSHLAAAGIILLLAILLSCNALAIYLRNRFRRKI